MPWTKEFVGDMKICAGKAISEQRIADQAYLSTLSSLVKNPNMNHIRQILTERIQSAEGVVAVNTVNLEFNRQERTLAVDYEATTNYGLLTNKIILGYGK